MMMKTKLVTFTLACTLATLVLTSCLGQVISLVGPKPDYPGERPPSVVAAGAGNQYYNKSSLDLPPTQEEMKRGVTMRGNIPVGLNSQWRDCVRSPYGNRPELYTHKLPSGSLVTDPFERKQFYLP